MKRGTSQHGWHALRHLAAEESTRLDRAGSTLLIVVALLGMLALLGFVFYTFAAQERQNANYFSDAARQATDPGLDYTALMEWGLQQLIQGSDRPQSALFGGRHSLLVNMFGRDLHPYSGEGVHVQVDPLSGGLFVDQDYNVLTPQSSTLLRWNDSSAAWNDGSVQAARSRVNSRPAPDVDYTYPDINNVFLAYRGFTYDSVTGADVPVLIPSFHRPQYLRNLSTGMPILDWESNNDPDPDLNTVQRVMRPHPGHVVFGSGGVRRFIGTQAEADTVFGTTPNSGPFPFTAGPGPDGIALTADDVHRSQGVWSVTTGATPGAYEYDKDNDGDGIREGVYLDLDFPVQEDAAGKQFVPLFSFTVYDLDALINLNIHGNLSGDVNLAGVPFGGGAPVSRSNAGLGPSEVNPLWALDADPATASVGFDWSQHIQYFGHAPANRLEAGNMEWWWLNTGRGTLPLTSPPELVAGRYGELQRLYNVLNGTVPLNPGNFPLPGISTTAALILVDDDQDLNEGERIGGRRPYVHPLDFLGLGRYWQAGNPKAPQLLAFAGASNPVRALQYTDYSTRGSVLWAQLTYGTDGAPGIAGVDDDGDGNIDWLPDNTPDTKELGALGSDDIPFMTSIRTNALMNHPLEIIVEPTKAKRPWDEIFGVQDLPFLHLQASDIAGAVEVPETRLEKLARFHFERVEAHGLPSWNLIRQRFTTHSFDRKQFGIPQFPQWGRNWEWSADSNNNAQGGNGALGREFPPQFSDGTVTIPAFAEDLNGNGVQDAGDVDANGNGTFEPHLDPYRPQVRRLLQTEIGNVANLAHQFPLSINHILDVERLPGATANERTGPLKFRPLTPHPDDPRLSGGTVAIDQIPPANPLPPFPPQSWTSPTTSTAYSGVEVQEFWARRDRQKLARDIYVLLYTLGGRDGVNATGNNGGGTIHADADLRRMAQFAVNLVDAMDRDRVITKFEYDKNLGNGWNLDDDPYSDENISERAAVFGVEAQTLTLSEAVGIVSSRIDPTSGANHAATAYDDTDDPERSFLYVELRNAGPFSVPLTTSLSNNANNGIWRIRRDDNNDSALNGDDAAVTFLTPGAGAPPGPIAAGGLYSIGSSDARDTEATSGAHRPSDLRIDYDLDGTYNLIIPNVPDYATVPDATTLPTDPNLQPKLNLDLVHARDDNKWGLVLAPGLGAPSKGDWAKNLHSLVGGSIRLVLERRVHMGAPRLSDTSGGGLDDAANPWVEVDRITVPIRKFDIQNGTTAVELHDPMNPDLLDPLVSRERDEPLDRNSEASSTGSGDGLHYTTMHGSGAGTMANSITTNPFTLWQPHFDRDFASVIDLLAIPLYGPGRVTADLSASRAPPQSQAADPKVAGAMFLFPGTNPQNRWHRLLAFVEVPTRTHRELGDPLETTRVPGKINLNTLRHPEVLAALVDDRDIIQRDYSNPGRYLPDQSGDGAARDWWGQFVRARDGVPGLDALGNVTSVPDPVSGLYLPGVAGSKPFRSLAFAPQGVSSVEYTLLRSLPMDNALDPTEDGRQLFELGTLAEHQSTGANPDHYMRHRMLSKIANNVTTRSNTFVVFISVDFFEAATLPSGAVRIGGQFDVDGNGDLTNDGYRGVFVVDRSDVEAAYDQTSGQFDWRALVKHGLRLE